MKTNCVWIAAAWMLGGCSLVLDASSFGRNRDGSVAGDAPTVESDAGPCGTCRLETPHCDGTQCRECLNDLHCDDADPCTIDRCGLGGICDLSPRSDCVHQVTVGNDDRQSFTHICGIRGVRAYCWGANGYGEIGRAETGFFSEPFAVPQQGGFHVTAHLSAGSDHTCGTTPHGEVFCWGLFGRIGYSPNYMDRQSSGPIRIGFADTIALSSGGGSRSCAVHGARREVACWGSDNLGNPEMRESLDPVPVFDVDDPVLDGIRDVSVGDMHSCAVRESGEVVCWGRGRYGSAGGLGEDYTVDETPYHIYNRPVRVNGLNDAVRVSAARHHTCALRATGQVACWGFNYNGELGNNEDTTWTAQPTSVVGLDDAVAISAGAQTCALRRNGDVACWGRVSAVNSRIPIPIPSVVAAEISCGGISCARLRSTGEIVCWTADDSSPTPVTWP